MSGQEHLFSTAQVPFDQALARVRSDFLEMPGLRVTAAQACRLWTIDVAVCDAVLAALVETRFLARTNDRYFIRTR